MKPNLSKRFALSLAAVLTGASALCAAETADAIYRGGDILTINDAAPTAEALAVKDGKILAAAGDTTVKQDLLKGRKVGAMTYKVHLDGYDLGPALRGTPV